MRYLIATFTAVLILLSVHPAVVLAEQVQLEVVDYGSYKHTFTGDVQKSDEVVAGVVKPSSSMDLLEQTDKIPGVLGTTFGFRFTAQEGSIITDEVLRFCGKHPPMKNPETGTVLTEECFSGKVKSEKILWHVFVIEKEWEIVRGPWKLFIEQDGVILAEQSFIVE